MVKNFIGIYLIYQVIFVSLKSAVSPRPTAWILERSFDGTDFLPWQYFGASDADCRSRYNLPGQNEPYAFDSDIQSICSTQFSKAIPLENGEIHLKLLEGRPGASFNGTSTTLNDFTLARFIRIRFQGMHTTTNSAGSNIQWLVNRNELGKRSFYSLRYIKIGARLDCNGHAQRAKQYNDDEIIECDCSHNTCGVNCEKCCPLYNQKPYKQGTSTDSNKCEKCECYGHSTECYYNPEVDQRGLSINTDGVYSGGGVCLNCTDLTTGINCEKCLTNYYRPYGVSPNVKEPCIPCECNPNGSIGTCSAIGGACTCRKGFTGPKCSECEPGYKGANCTKCACDSRGTMPGGECESHCQCKLYVEGENCDKCIPGYFALSESNREGCTQCFCSGVSQSCESSNIITNAYETLDDWKITDVSRSFIMHPSKDNDTGFLVFNTFEMSETDAIYWLAPNLYLGNKLQSYGLNIIFMITWVVVRGDTSGKPTFGPTIILVGENGMKIAFGDNTFQETNSTITIRLTEHGWYQIPASIEGSSIGNKLRRNEYRGDQVSRTQFLSVLRNIESMLFRGTFHSDQVESVLIRVTLKSSKETEDEIGSNLVEQCKCPMGYTGLSCENCEFGYVRAHDNKTLDGHLNVCLPCSCYGHAETCDLENHKCGSCKHNTTGERCEDCATGFYGNAKMGTPSDCKRCACPLINDENNFSPTCQLRDLTFENQNEVTSDYSLIPYRNSDFVCTQCPDGYIGDHCESCADGYFGNPTKLLSKCTKCSCNGGPCDPISGKCITCQGNTEGWRCERCRAGFYGNPVKGCEICRCNETGSENTICNSESGQCQCKKNYAGYQCDECAFGYADVKLECPPCNCNVSGSIQQFCDTHTGQCPCKIGVEGLKCDECIDGSFGLSEDGCQDCHCNPSGSLSETCDKRNGQCKCRKNVVGRACDRCLEEFWNLESADGCQSCACNEVGSINLNCSTHTGQCNCKLGVGGQKCDTCLEGFYGFSSNGCKQCDMCSNPAYNCDPESGRCVCPPNSKGIDCSQCMPNSYGYSHKKGCKFCDCDHGGSIGQSCDLYTGQCVCREGFTGRRCDECANGFFAYPRCERCNCNYDGSQLPTNSTDSIPCNENGQCTCKAFVAGLKCDSCIPSTFGLSHLNPDGCSKCFCFDRSTECRESDLSWGIIRATDVRYIGVEYQNTEFVTIQAFNKDQFITYEANLDLVNGLSIIPGTSGNVSIGSSRGFEVPLYFELPKQFLGDRLLSYAGRFKFSIEMKECKTELDRLVLQQFPLVRIHSHNSLILDYFGAEIFDTNPNISYNLRFTEAGWRSQLNDQAVPRELFMTALQNVTNIFVRASSSVAFTKLTISNISLETAIYLSGSKSNLAIGIEKCECPESYNGSSCQNPARGYYRYRSSASESLQETIEDFIGQSIPCQCNGRSNLCNIETGYCESCNDNTGGANCEVCAEGYYGSPNDFGCEPCPCPTTERNFAKGCIIHQGRVQCACKPGYEGQLCDNCAKGYHNSSNTADGICLDCQCNPHGSISMECDLITGNCLCKPGVIGRRCDQCQQLKSTLRNGSCEVCDNCTLTLLESSDDLGYMIVSETDLIDKDGVPAPWPRLLMFENSTKYLTKKFVDLSSAIERLENYNDLQIDKLNTKGSNIIAKWEKLLVKSQKRINASDSVRDTSMIFLEKMRSIQDDSQERINQLNLFGLNSHHVNMPIAAAESESLLQDILEIVDNQNGAFRAHQCANTLVDLWSNTSEILTAQMDEAIQIKYDVINTKNRIYDLTNNVHETSKTLSNVESIRLNSEKGFEKSKHKFKIISQLRNNLTNIYNTSVIPQTDVSFNIIDDHHEKIKQDLSNIIRLKTIVHETNAQCAQQIKNIRLEWLPRAETHSSTLMNRANEYVKLFQNTKNSAEVAMLASTAYKNISESISSAHQLAIEAKKAAIQSELELYPKQDDSVIEKSMKSLKKSHKIHQNAQREIEKLEDLEFALKGQKRKVDSIKNSIWQTGLRNNNISLALNTFSKNDTQEFLRQTIDASKKVSDQMREVRRGAISVMSSDVYKLKLKLASLEPQWAVKFGLAEENVSQSLRNIKNIKNTLSTIETISSRNDEKFRKWNQTMSVMMQNLKDKITKARHIAEGIRVSMESKTKCIRSYSPPSFGLYTANTIKFSIALKSKSITSSILFLQGEDNRFLAIEMVKRKIRFAWNLGGDTASVTHSLDLHKKELEYDEAWYQIEVNRTMNVGSLTVRQMGIESNKSPMMVTSASHPEFTRIIFTPANRLWIGGVPEENRPSALIAHDAGLHVVLSNIYVDNKQVGLWNFMHTEGECDGAIFGAREITTNYNVRHFNGQGYSVVKKERSKPHKKNFFALQMMFKTFDENALLFLVVDEKNKRSVSVTLSGGRIVFQIDYGGDSKLEINTTKRYNNGQWVSIEVAREFTTKRSTENGSLKVNNEEPITGSPTTPITSSLLPDFARAAYYLGGIPPGFEFITSKPPGADAAYLGCMKDISINGETYDPLETSVRFGVEASCKEIITRVGYHGNGYLELPNHSLKKRANIGFVFRTQQSDALLLLADVPPAEIENNFDEKDLRSNYSFVLSSGRLIFWADAGRGRIELMSNNTLHDGEYHTVNVLKVGRKFELRIDDEYQMSKSLTQHPFVINMIEDIGGFYVGGMPDGVDMQQSGIKLNQFRGTIKDFVINNQTVSFSNVINFRNVDIGRDGPVMGSGHRYNDLLMKTEPIGKNSMALHEGCHRFGAYSYEANAFKFGDTLQSYSVISVAKNSWQNDFEIQFDFRTYYPNGLLFVVPGTKEKKKHFFTMILRNGQATIVARGRKRSEVIISRKLNDGQWHRVTLKSVNKELSIRIQSEDQNSSTDVEIMKMPRRISVSNMMYVGGMVDSVMSFELTAKLEQFKGCIRRFHLNNVPKDLASPGRHFGIGQCFPNVEKGSYFAGDAYATYKRIFHVGKFLELHFEFRTSELNGVLLSVSEPVGFPALSIELHKGKIVMSCDLGDGNPFRIESNLSTKYAMCDNKWHNISAIYDSNQIAIRIDDSPSVNRLKQHDTLSKVHTKSPLYIGGIPETAASGTLLSRENFKGCIRNVVIRNELRDWTDMDDLQNVLLSECLTMS